MDSAGYPLSMRKLINELVRLPSIGEKSAIRLAYHLVTNEDGHAVDLAKVIVEAKETIRYCEVCYMLSDEALCNMCRDAGRARSVIGVVEKPADVIALERSGGFNGLYHVLHGLWSPLRGIGPEQTKIPQLVDRVEHSQNSSDLMYPKISEVILATSTTVEGDATAMYIANNLKSLDVQVTRLAQGLPKGGELEYADQVTLSHALKGRGNL